jgi:hypothetical protein
MYVGVSISRKDKHGNLPIIGRLLITLPDDDADINNIDINDFVADTFIAKGIIEDGGD